MIVGKSAVYSPTCTGNPAIVAYAIAIGITTAALVSPASTSGRSHSFRYPISQSSMKTRSCRRWVNTGTLRSRRWSRYQAAGTRSVLGRRLNEPDFGHHQADRHADQAPEYDLRHL